MNTTQSKICKILFNTLPYWSERDISWAKMQL